jgi:hypothetical protein
MKSESSVIESFRYLHLWWLERAVIRHGDPTTEEATTSRVQYPVELSFFSLW